jgi:tetratricopeptide (TPR) repeat protein
LANYAGEETTEAFNVALTDEDALIRYTALQNLMAPSAERMVELVSPLLFDPVQAVRIEAASRLAGGPTQLLRPYQREALDETIREYEATMTYSLDFAFAGHNLGNLYGRLGDAHRAERYYRSAIEIDDLFYPAKVNLALLYNASGRNAEAEQLLREVLAAYPDRSDVAYSLGLLLAEMGRLEDAVEFLGLAATTLPDRGRVHYNYGLALQSLGRPVEAETALQTAIETDPDNLDFLYALADHYVKRELWDHALAIADRIIAAHPESDVGRNVRELVQQQKE